MEQFNEEIYSGEKISKIFIPEEEIVKMKEEKKEFHLNTLIYIFKCNILIGIVKMSP